MLGDDPTSEFVIVAILDDELHLVMPRQQIDILPVVLVGLAAARTFHVHDLDDARRHTGNGAMPAGFEHHGIAAIEQHIHQRKDIFLEKRLSASDLDEPALMRLNLLNYIVNRSFLSFVKRVRSVAPGAPQVAGGKTHEYA